MQPTFKKEKRNCNLETEKIEETEVKAKRKFFDIFLTEIWSKKTKPTMIGRQHSGSLGLHCHFF